MMSKLDSSIVQTILMPRKIKVLKEENFSSFPIPKKLISRFTRLFISRLIFRMFAFHGDSENIPLSNYSINIRRKVLGRKTNDIFN